MFYFINKIKSNIFNFQSTFIYTRNFSLVSLSLIYQETRKLMQDLYILSPALPAVAPAFVQVVAFVARVSLCNIFTTRAPTTIFSYDPTTRTKALRLSTNDPVLSLRTSATSFRHCSRQLQSESAETSEPKHTSWMQFKT